MPERLESLLAEVPFLAPLRRDELHRASKRFEIVPLAAGETRRTGEGRAQLVVVVGGEVTVEACPIEGQAPVRARLRPGDHVGAVSLLAGGSLGTTVRAETAARLALLDGEGYRAIEREFPAVAIPACAALAEELAWKDDLLREVAAIDTDYLQGPEREAAFEARRRRVAGRLAHRGARIVRRAEAAGDLVRAWLRDPAFWMLAGFLTAFGGARMVVSYILRNHKEHQLFALYYTGLDKNPIHIHHFNYGLILVTVTSLLAFFSTFRIHIRMLAFGFGVGAGLIFDEFALIWNLNPDYYQSLSRIAAVAVGLLLAQLAFLREPWARSVRRLTRREEA
jgi:hypothetical protein